MDKKLLVKKLVRLQKSLNVPMLWQKPSHRTSKDWLAETAAVLKNLDESDYQEFQNHRQHLYSSILRTTRKHAAEQIDNFIRLKKASYLNYDFEPPKPPVDPYIPEEIIEKFKQKKDSFDYSKLVDLLNELNDNFIRKNKYATLAMLRAVLDHVPPLLGFDSFESLASQYAWTRIDKAYMKSLVDFKQNAHDALHRSISEDKDVLQQDLPQSNRVVVLLKECLKGGSDKNLEKYKTLVASKKERKPNAKINITVPEDGFKSWQNYACSNYGGYSYSVKVDIDNTNNPKPEYIVNVWLEGNGGKWKSEHFIFDIERFEANTPFKVDAYGLTSPSICISDQPFTRFGSEHKFRPSIDESTLVLFVETKSGARFEIPIKKINR